ncbi:ABC transporter permease [Variovorax sp. SRS16]|uniref:ABC transporter permease n=1 Tax=Variovorax sp. SRS16 TaxID=282217 RepID=UPI001E4FD35A|nr:ABC transporter permease [Variovorax sp. SRS16]
MSSRRGRREEAWQWAISAPAILFIVFLLVLPLIWLLWLSFRQGDDFTLAHYARIAFDPAYAESMWLTLRLALAVTFLCVIVGYPLCYMLANTKPWISNLCLILVIVPFWTSLLVRTYAWLVLLQRSGIVNNLLLKAELVEQPLYLMHNATGTLIGMFHIMLPFFVLPLYASLKRIDADLLKAAASVGASPWTSFWRVYFPLSSSGLVAGALLVFVVSLGFYITPALLGGGKTITISILLERNVNLFMEWGSASSVATVFLLIMGLLFWVANRFVSLERMFEGG